FFSSRRRHTRFSRDWSSDVCSSDLELKSRFNHTRTLLNNLLDWTLLQMDKLNLQPTRIDLHKLVEENIQLLSSVPNKQIALHNQIGRASCRERVKRTADDVYRINER